MRRRLVPFCGFLGSGKTTLLSRLLRRPSARRAAVLVNEFGEVGLDHHLLRAAGGRAALLGGGCVCCDGSGDLAGALMGLLDGETEEPVLLEASGLADPAGVVRAVLSHPVLGHHYAVGPVVTTVDAVNGRQHLDQREAEGQISAADTLVLTKTDLADPEATETLAGRIRAINPAARILRSHPGGAVPDDLLDPDAPTVSEAPASLDQPERHASARSVSLTFDGPVDWAGFGLWLSMLLHARGDTVLRVKGLLDTGDKGPVVLDGVGETVHPPRHLDAWPDGDRRSRLVLITRGTEPDDLLASLSAFEPVLGAGPRPLTFSPG